MDALTEAEQDRDDSDRPEHPYGLFTTRMFGLLDTMRRSGTLAYRRGFGLSMVEWRIVTQLGVNSPLSLNDLAERIVLDRGQLSRTVKQMVGRGLLVSRRRPGGPAIMITLSGEGQGLYRRLVALATERNAFLVAGISEADLACASAVIAAVKEKAQLLLEREQAISATNSSEEP
ncbi:MAG: MarR family transcriptional regulator [Sphingomonas bacterium]